MLIPNVLYRDAHGQDRYPDLFSCLLAERIVWLSGEISDECADVICAELLYLDSLSHEDIMLYISSPGGSVSAGLMIIDVMSHISSDVSTCVLGSCCSMATVLASCGAKDKRYCLPHSEYMIHQPSGGFQGQVSDLEPAMARFRATKQLLAELLASSTGQPVQKILTDFDRDYYMNAEEAMAYGLCDYIFDQEEAAPCDKS